MHFVFPPLLIRMHRQNELQILVIMNRATYRTLKAFVILKGSQSFSRMHCIMDDLILHQCPID